MRSILLAVAMLLAAAPAVAATNAVAGFTGGTQFSSVFGRETIGWSFNTANTIEVTSLGWFVVPGFAALASDHQVGIWSTTGTLLGTTTVTAGARTDGDWRFGAVSPFTLLAGDYVIGGLDTQTDNDFYLANVSDLAMASGITMLTARFNTGPGFSFPSFVLADSIGRFGPSFQFNTLQAPGAIPEPASWAMLIAGFGLVGAAARRRRLARAV